MSNEQQKKCKTHYFDLPSGKKQKVTPELRKRIEEDSIQNYDLDDLFSNLIDFNGADQNSLLFHLNYAFAAYAEKSPQMTQDSFKIYGILVTLINAINSKRDILYKMGKHYKYMSDMMEGIQQKVE